MRMLACVDLRRKEPEFVVDEAAWYARRAHATVDLLFVEPSGTPAPGNTEALQQLLARIGPEQRGKVIHPTGSPVDVIVEYSSKFDLVVVGPREPGPVERMLLGSIAARVVRQARAPILVVRTRAEDQSKSLRVLVAVDLQQPQPLVDHAVSWAQRFDAVIDLIHVDSVQLPQIGDTTLRGRLEKEREQYRRRDQAHLERLLAAAPHEHRGSARLADGEHGPTINAYAEDYDAVILGSHGRRGVARLVLGSVAETVVRGADTSVLVFPPPVEG